MNANSESIQTPDAVAVASRQAMRILLVEDEFDVARSICEYLENHGHEVEWAPDGLAGMESAARQVFDMIIIDISLPRMSGIALCRRLRELDCNSTPMLILTARDDLACKLEAFEAGADDYVVKPFALEELLVRMNALARRSNGLKSGPRLKVADLEYDLATQKVSRSGMDLSVPLMGRRILELLMRNPHRVVSRHEIESAVWEGDVPQSDVLRIHIHSLRDIIDKPFPVNLLETVRGIGYRLYDPDEAD
jgi:DNA-binding response OmpR family regulator